MDSVIINTLIGAGAGAFVAGIFQLINHIIDTKQTDKKTKKEKDKTVLANKEEVYIAAIEHLQYVRQGFDFTNEEATSNEKYLNRHMEHELRYAPLSAKLRLYASDEIFDEYSRLMFYSSYAFAHENRPRLMENSKEAFSQQVVILAKRMQVDLGIRGYNKGYEITCPECSTVHDAFDSCPRCKMSYKEYMEKMQISALQQINSEEELSPFEKEGYAGYFLLKFMEKREYQELFLKGKLFFNTSDYYMNCKEEGRGDSTEGKIWEIKPGGKETAKLTYVGGRPIIAIIDGSQALEDYQQMEVQSYSPAEARFRKIISFFTLYVNSNDIQDIPEKVESEFGEFGVLITDPVELYRRIIEGIKEHKSTRKAQLGYVEYIDDGKEGLIEYGPFRKGMKYSYQNEFRATFVDDTREPVVIDVGDLNDIAKPLFKDGVKEMSMKDGILHYPVYGKDRQE